jgi:predicted nuclease of predicted toxin-antitoxin system
MKLLIDSCVAASVTRRLRADGHDVAAVAELDSDPGDRAILALAFAQQRALITHDSDFGALVFRDSAERVGVLRLREAPAAALAERASCLVIAHAADLEQGAFVTDDGDQARINRP